ncbi:hypothetical protein HPB52_008726 [Rhipicephalus sanguineus]|uniref:Septin-type G domain-containing protein n=2 Tax=Rhipicephalus sanguineus TaxID=34632 RepID=A0A9D4SYH9_RHISA|nr:hypothetical protein HPB52_008726 [Rhipicephalus sanguineus]
MPVLPHRSSSSDSATGVSARPGSCYPILRRFFGQSCHHGIRRSSRSSSTPPRPDRQKAPSRSSLTLTSDCLPSDEEQTELSKLCTDCRDSNFDENKECSKVSTSKSANLVSSHCAVRRNECAGVLSSAAVVSAPFTYASMADNISASHSYAGFASLPNQVYRRVIRKGFEFTLMVVGESGLGKSTLVNSMFMANIYGSEYPGPSHRVKKTTCVEATRVRLREGSVDLTLTVVDTPGFGDAVDNNLSWQPISDYIEAMNAQYFTAESRVRREAFRDNRVHCCLYFIPPVVHGLRPLDIEFMKRLHDKVNLVPVIAKADTMTAEECRRFKRMILREIRWNKISLYEFPNAEDEEERKLQSSLKERVPFAVIGSDTTMEANGRKFKGRSYPWGVVDIENSDICDYNALRDMLIRTNTQDLKQVTNDVHYENYRRQKLAILKRPEEPDRASLNNNLLSRIKHELKENEASLLRTRKVMEQGFKIKIQEKTQTLKEMEVGALRKHEQMMKDLEQKKMKLKEKRRNFEDDKTKFEAVYEDKENIFRKNITLRDSEEHTEWKDDGN